jgi:hypothetical protein
MRLIILVICVFMLLLLTACNSSGTLKVYNQTSFNVYMTVEGVSYTIPEHSTKALEIDTGTQTIFTGVQEKKLPLTIFGETWMIVIYVDDQPVYIKNTTVKIRSGETTKVYCAPILAAVKINNHSTQAITAMTYTLHQPPFGEITKEVDLTDSISTNEEFFTPLPPAGEENMFYFTFQIKLSDGTWLIYGNQTTILFVDDEFIIDVYDPLKHVAGLH